jgi:hypothetical protein
MLRKVFWVTCREDNRLKESESIARDEAQHKRANTVSEKKMSAIGDQQSHRISHNEKDCSWGAINRRSYGTAKGQLPYENVQNPRYWWVRIPIPPPYLPHGGYEAIPHPSGILGVTFKFLQQSVILKRGADDEESRCSHPRNQTPK